MKTFSDDVRSVLKERGYAKQCHALEALAQAVDENRRYALNKVRFYKWSGFFLLTFIPIISALLSVLVGISDHDGNVPPETFVFWLSLALTLFTILNSIFAPSKRFNEACRIGIGIQGFMVDFMIELERMSTVDEAALLKLVQEKRKEFEKCEIDLIGMMMPLEMAGQSREGQAQASRPAGSANSGLVPE